MTTPSPQNSATPPGVMPRRRVRPKLVLLLAGLTVLISASVVVTDCISPRDRSRPAASLPSNPPPATRAP